MNWNHLLILYSDGILLADTIHFSVCILQKIHTKKYIYNVKHKFGSLKSAPPPLRPPPRPPPRPFEITNEIILN